MTIQKDVKESSGAQGMSTKPPEAPKRHLRMANLLENAPAENRFVKDGPSVIVRLGKLLTVNAGQELTIEAQF